mmetsp:Transcript_29594/g.81368  ORF Transcript_29594/g.81368 Transcript_29594/m.81368 type:complete len:221 (+) Transcript_29594:183-845(+)
MIAARLWSCSQVYPPRFRHWYPMRNGPEPGPPRRTWALKTAGSSGPSLWASMLTSWPLWISRSANWRKSPSAAPFQLLAGKSKASRRSCWPSAVGPAASGVWKSSRASPAASLEPVIATTSRPAAASAAERYNVPHCLPSQISQSSLRGPWPTLSLSKRAQRTAGVPGPALWASICSSWPVSTSASRSFSNSSRAASDHDPARFSTAMYCCTPSGELYHV